MIGPVSDFDNVPAPNPDVVFLKAEIAKFRAELSMLVLERDELLHHECKNIEMAYMLAVGALEYKAYELECAILRLKRKTELIQAQKNRQQKPNLTKIEATLDSEFSEYQAKLDELVEKMNRNITRGKGRVLTDDEDRKLKQLYHIIVKTLHPDLHPKLSSAKLKLFHNAVEAYEKGDLAGLEIIHTMVFDADLPKTDSSGSFDLLSAEKSRLLKLIQTVKNNIATIKTEFPYTAKALVHSPEKTKTRKSELEKRIHDLTTTRTAYTARIEDMLR